MNPMTIWWYLILALTHLIAYHMGASSKAEYIEWLEEQTEQPDEPPMLDFDKFNRWMERREEEHEDGE